MRWTILLLLASTLSISAQDATDQAKQLEINKSIGEIKIDGVLDDAGWQGVQRYSDFWVQAPDDGRLAQWQTEVMVTYDAGGIYVAARLHDENGQVNGTLKRDQFTSSDGFGVVIDPTGQKTNGYGFGTNAKNARTETLVVVDQSDPSWDNRWRSASRVHSDHWIVEYFIPFSSLRFDSDSRVWGINFFRNDKGLNETHVWSPIPRQFQALDLGYCGQMIWDQAPGAQKTNISLIPYATSRIDHDPSADPSTKTGADIGGDAKIAITSGLNLDLTVNPDFSQVDVDQLQTNLTRFNIFFPERRQFFLENADLFSAYGQFQNQPFYSRRIGLDPLGNTVPILYGARLSGNLTEKLRLGVLNMHSNGTETADGQNFTSVATQYRIGARSSIKGLFLNRQAYDGSESISGDYGRNYGGEVNLSTKDGTWAGQLGLIQSQKEGFSDKNRHLYGRFEYNGERFRTFLFVQNLGQNYYADMGFNARINNYDPVNNRIVRIGYTQIGNMLNYFIYPQSDRVNYHWSGFENFIIINEGNDVNDWYTRLRHFIFYQNTSELRFRLNRHHRELIFPFALTATPLPTGEYTNYEMNVEYRSDNRKDFRYEIFSVYGGFFNGNKLTNRVEISYRIQPTFSLGITAENNTIRLPEPYGDLDITQIGARAEVNFSTSLFWTTFWQYNTQAKRMNVNTRLQWRYAPMSDIFLVYTDNYTQIDGLSPQGRNLVLKASYWLNL